ncbi:LacI family transcriptional regulator [Terrimicrobium sacchariphilum]|uniref:LacI family transcriptional regulator n=1 Tax=Terrimicrobium sacchariphilum TaxID=690879 RepID=A0A146G4Z7_TERSA|nr:LacI family DNA-binding transcriptional regulator [Terrimicrobium sacchariphilum]GAT32670.1 LacI family transcriptional regulator [Terrimicrobium sacchariphilum]
MSHPTYRQIAEIAKVSIFSVSCALRNRPGVSQEVRKRITEVARTLGYKPNPMVTALMTGHRRSNARRRMRAIIACLTDRKTRRNRGLISTNRESYQGYRDTLDEAGFSIDEFLIEDYFDNPRKLFTALTARRVPGIIIQAGVIPPWDAALWKNYAMASVGNRQLNVPCHFAGTDHYRNAWLAMTQLAALGYRRIGLAMSRADWIATVDYRALSACLGWSLQGGLAIIPPHWTETWDRTRFLQWVEKQRPDAVLAAEHEPLIYLQEAGVKIPGEIGFAHLGLDSTWTNLAGIRQNNFEVGQAAAKLVIDQINRNEYGVPEHPCSVQISGTWFAGPSATPQESTQPSSPGENHRSKPRRAARKSLGEHRAKRRKTREK